MPTYTALIIDDELPARLRLRRLLAEYENTIIILDETSDGNEALLKIESLKPNIIFLDIQMPGLNGFEILKQITHMPIVIFTTAFDQYALKAFETNSVDYLLKPIEPSRLQQSISKLERISETITKDQVQTLIDIANQLKPKKVITSIPVKNGDTIHLIRISEVAYLEANDKYVTIHTIEGKEFLTEITLKLMEEKQIEGFLRVHRSFIINMGIISEIHKYFQSRFVLLLNDKSHTKITSGSAYFDAIKNSLEQV